MIDILKEIILDFQAAELNLGVLRRLQVTAIQNKTLVCIGVRRSGKSTFMLQLIDRLLKEGVVRQNILYLNFFDDRLHAMQHESLFLVLEAYYALYPEKKKRNSANEDKKAQVPTGTSIPACHIYWPVLYPRYAVFQNHISKKRISFLQG